MKKENFDLKLRVYHLEDRLRQMAPANVDNALKENVELKVQNEALLAEIKSHQEIISEAQTAIEQYRQQNASRPGAEAELGRLRQELEMTVQQLGKSQSLCQKYEGQLALFDKESRETLQRMKQGDMESSGLQKRLADAQHTIERLEEDIRSLEDELESKNGLIHQFKLDSQGMSQELELITRQMTELQDALRACQSERDNLLRERDTIKRNTLNDVAKQTGMSPRSSLDLLESKLMRELGQATKRLQDLEKQTETSQGEKEQLAGQSQTLAQSLEQATQAIRHLGSKISGSAIVGPVPIDGTFPEVFAQVERATDSLIRDCHENRQAKTSLGETLAKQEQISSSLQSDRQRLEMELSRAENRLNEISLVLNTREEEIKRTAQMAEEWQRKAAAAYDAELPKLHEELVALRSEQGRLLHDLEGAKEEVRRAQAASTEFKSKWEEAQSIAIQASSESSDRLAHISQLQQSRADLAKRLASSEEMAQSLNRRLEEMRTQLEHADKVKAAVEEGFNRQLKQLHQQNTELKLQMASNSSGASDANARLERLNAAVESLRLEKDSLFNKLQTKEHSIGALQQELDTLRIDRKRTETDLVLREEQLRKCELELARLRKDDQHLRKNTDGIHHLQAKIESLTALNTFLREQTEQKDKSIREYEERLRRQADEMRTTMTEVDAQSRKLKKREQLISQALRRLESINSLQLTGESLSSLAAPTTSHLNVPAAAPKDYSSYNYDSYKPSSSLGQNILGAPTEELTPIRPTKLPFSNMSSKPATNKENSHFANYEF